MTTTQKLLVTICFLFFSVSACSAQSAGNSRNESTRIAVKLSLSKKSFTVGEPIPAKVEISNTGDVPVLIANEVVMSTSTSPSLIKFEMKDDRGRAVPASFHTRETFGQTVEPNPAIAFLKWLLLLNPGYSLSTIFMIDSELFETMDKPGTYTLSALYTSNGLAYPPVLAVIGVTENDVKSLPFVTWTGNIRTNELTFKITSTRSRAGAK